MTHSRVLMLFSIAASLAGCAELPVVSPAAAPAPAPTPAPVSPAPPPAMPAPPEPPAAPAAATLLQRQQAQAAAQAAAGALETGNEDLAKVELQRALSLDAGNRLAQSLRRQVSEDPQVLLGRESFPYTVRPNDSMSGLAGRFLKDVYLFYALARYNGIAVPRHVAAGQTLRIPGKAPLTTAAPEPEPAPLPPPAAPSPPAPASAPAAIAAAPSVGEQALRAAEAAERANDVERALAEYGAAVAADQPGAAARLARLVKQEVGRHTKAARTAFAKQDLDGAIQSWERVLRLEPANDMASFELQRCKTLKEKVRRLPDKL